jgi:histidyl-tRNA synthetase
MQSTRGMYDILPEEIKYWQHIYQVALETLSLANYYEVRTPIIEETSLFSRSIGRDTDIVNKEMYNFIDKGGRLLTLRPEGTAGVARSIIQHKLCNQHQIQKLWYLGPMFRYERPQNGRQRQFHQLGLECYGSSNPAIDAEIIYLANNILRKLHCSNYRIEINSIGSLESRKRYEVKLQDYLRKYYKDLSTESQIRLETNTIRLLDSKDKSLQEILLSGPQLTDVLEVKSIEHFEKVKEYLRSMDINYIVNSQLVRGLDYYNDTVFEIKTDELGGQNTICGGGRYDTLTNQLGQETIPSIGWGIGIERLLLLTKDKLILNEDKIFLYIATQNDHAMRYALSLTPLFQMQKLKYEIDLSQGGFHKQIKKAYKKQAEICILIGIDEVKTESITVKWLKEYKQSTYSKPDFIKLVQSF